MPHSALDRILGLRQPESWPTHWLESPATTVALEDSARNSVSLLIQNSIGLNAIQRPQSETMHHEKRNANQRFAIRRMPDCDS